MILVEEMLIHEKIVNLSISY